MNIFDEDLNISGLIKYAEKEKVWLPEFQRPFVWDNNQIRLLIDSLYNNYTISSILLWEGGDELARRRVGARVKDIIIPEEKEDNVVYLLDGQQRTTALALAFTDKTIYRGNNTTKKESLNIYWDSEYKGDDPELRWIRDDEKVNLNGNGKYITLRNYEEKEIFRQFSSRFVKLKHAYNFDDNVIDTWYDISVEKEEIAMLRFKNDYNKKLNDLNLKILQRNVYDIEQKGSLEQVLEVFERINTKNTKLSIFDIMVAKTYRKYEKGYFDLRTYYKIINHTDSIKANYFENLDYIDLDNVSFNLDESDLLGITNIILRQKFKATEILKLTTPQLMENTKLLHDKFQFLVGFMNQQFNIEKEELWKYQPMMKFLASAISKFQDIDYSKQEFLKKWFWNTLLMNRYPGAQNERIAKDFDRICSDESLDTIMSKMLNDNTRNYNNIKNNNKENPEYFSASYNAKSQQIYRALVLLLKSKKAKDFYFGLEPVKSGASAYLLEEHHIFPKNSTLGKSITSKYSNHKNSDIINNIANIALITKDTNNKRIKARNPSDYILQFEQEYKEQGKYGEFINIMESQFISPDMLELLKKDDFEDFIFQRTQVIYEQIFSLCETE